MSKLNIFLFFAVLFVGCKKETIIIDGNNPPFYDKVPTIKIQNYVNRIFIDLIGREPLDSEMDENVDYLRKNNLSKDSRSVIIKKLKMILLLSVVMVRIKEPIRNTCITWPK